MRALADPGPGYVYWKYINPDYSGTYASSAIQTGTAIIISESISSKGLIYEVDFSTLADVDLTTGGDGAKTIDGKTWYLFRGGGGAADIVNGTGIVLTQQATAGNQRTNGFLGMSLGAATAVRLYIEIAFTPDAGSWPDYGGLYVGMGEIIKAQPTIESALPKYPFLGISSGDTINSYYNILSAAGTVPFNYGTSIFPTCLTSPKVLVQDCIDGVRICKFGESVVDSWPTSLNDLGFFVTTQVVNYYVNDEWGFRCMYFQTGTSKSNTYIIKKIRIETL